MSQNGQTHFKNLAAFAILSDHFGALCIKGLMILTLELMDTFYLQVSSKQLSDMFSISFCFFFL